jgi:hypothetical protein
MMYKESENQMSWTTREQYRWTRRRGTQKRGREVEMKASFPHFSHLFALRWPHEMKCGRKRKRGGGGVLVLVMAVPR